jgi:hypothetical protein
LVLLHRDVVSTKVSHVQLLDEGDLVIHAQSQVIIPGVASSTAAMRELPAVKKFREADHEDCGAKHGQDESHPHGKPAGEPGMEDSPVGQTGVEDGMG